MDIFEVFMSKQVKRLKASDINKLPDGYTPTEAISTSKCERAAHHALTFFAIGQITN